MNFLDLFAGIGGFRLGFTQAGANPIGYVEWDESARSSYHAMYDVLDEWTAKDITKVTVSDLREIQSSVDIITGGFPCQAFSVAGKRKGFQDTRGTLFFDIARIANILQPKAIVLENVKGLVNHNQGDTFDTIVRTLNEIGYVVDFDVLNSKDYGVPQNRERVFIIAIRDDLQAHEPWMINGTTVVPNGKRRLIYDDDIRTFNFNFPKKNVGIPTIQSILEPYVDKQFYLSSDIVKSFHLTERNRLRMNGGATMIAASRGRAINSTTTAQHLELNPYGVSNTLTSVQKDNYVIEFDSRFDSLTDPNKYHVRSLTPRECFRLQAFPDKLFDRASQVSSNTQLYRQAGNAVTVNVVKEIAKEVLKIIR